MFNSLEGEQLCLDSDVERPYFRFSSQREWAEKEIDNVSLAFVCVSARTTSGLCHSLPVYLFFLGVLPEV